MKSREKWSWWLVGMLAVANTVGWGFYLGECRAHAEARDQWQANLRLVGARALRGMMLEAEKAKEQALQPGKAVSH
jgi:hypothetical protein